VLLIQENDYRKVRAEIGPKALLAPHPVVFPPNEVRPQATRIGYVASGTKPNLDAISWFLREVWPSVYQPGISLHVYGSISNVLRHNKPSDTPNPHLLAMEDATPGITHFYQSRALEAEAQPGLHLHDFVEDLSQVYPLLDIVINPVRFGAGLKIKNMEALGYGIPLLTTSHGASGLEAHVATALLVADQAPAFAGQLQQLLGSYPLRRSLATAAHQLARTHFSPQECFKELLPAIHALQASGATALALPAEA